MNKENIWQYISRKLADEITTEEENHIKQWIEENETNRLTLEKLEQIWKYNAPKNTNTNSIYHTLHNRISQYNRKQEKKSFIYYPLRISAAIFLLVVSSFIIQKYVTLKETPEIVYQEIQVPKGSRTSVILPDSTKVWLSNDSKIKYPTQFQKDQRELELTGEAYFEVTHNAQKPFIVKIGENRIKVLGTKFSVIAYPDDNTVKTDLISGSIQFDIKNGEGEDQYKSYLLKPSESVVLDKKTGKLYQAEILDDFYDYWEKGIYVFNNESLGSLAQKISRIYNIEVVFGDETLKTKRFSGVMSVNDNIFTFFEAIKRTSIESIQYKYEKNKIYIKLN